MKVLFFVSIGFFCDFVSVQGIKFQSLALYFVNLIIFILFG